MPGPGKATSRCWSTASVHAPQGFARFSYDQRPKELDEVTVRPLDAYGALIWLRTRGDVARDRIVLQGWSNGASAALAAMEAPGLGKLTPGNGFRAALAFYPACGLKNQFADGLIPYAPVRIFHGSADEEVSPGRCETLARASRARNANIDIIVYPDAVHGFDDPGRARQSDAANVSAKADSTARSLAFVADVLKR